MKGKIIKQFKNGNYIVEITREVSTQYRVFLDGRYHTLDELAKGDCMSICELSTNDPIESNQRWIVIESLVK